jgi:hypothetical protein
MAPLEELGSCNVESDAKHCCPNSTTFFSKTCRPVFSGIQDNEILSADHAVKAGALPEIDLMPQGHAAVLPEQNRKLVQKALLSFRVLRRQGT